MAQTIRTPAYVVTIERGSFPIPLDGRLHVAAPGKVSVQGESRSDIAFSLKKRHQVRPTGGGCTVPCVQRESWGGGWVSVSVGMGTPSAPPELELRVPATLRQVMIETSEGPVGAFNLEGQIEVKAAAGTVQLDRIGMGGAVETGGGEIRVGEIGGFLRCISGGGGIFVTRAGADAVLETAGGEIFVGDVWGTLRALTGGGNVHVLRARRAVAATSLGGSVEINASGGAVRANTASGSIQVGSAIALDASTRMGSIAAGLIAQTLQNSVLQTSAGDITVVLPSNIAITVQAEGDAAGRFSRFFSEFPEIRLLLPRPVPSGDTALAAGSLNGGGPTLRLFASDGVIYLKRRK